MTNSPTLTDAEAEAMARLHPATAELVRRFSAALSAKLKRAEDWHGFTDGWARDDWRAECLADLERHIQKGDPLDVAAYAAFCWHHGWSTTPAPPTREAMVKRAQGLYAAIVSAIKPGGPDRFCLPSGKWVDGEDGIGMVRLINKIADGVKLIWADSEQPASPAPTLSSRLTSLEADNRRLRGLENPMGAAAPDMLDELMAACGGRDAPISHDPVTISANLAHGMLAALAGMIAVREALALSPEREGGSDGNGGNDRKFKFENGRFINRVSGEPIPDDEPIIIFRARDHHALALLGTYLQLAEDPHHQQAIRDRIAEFSAFRVAHGDRMKEPGITRDVVLNSTAPNPPASDALLEKGGE